MKIHKSDIIRAEKAIEWLENWGQSQEANSVAKLIVYYNTSKAKEEKEDA